MIVFEPPKFWKRIGTAFHCGAEFYQMTVFNKKAELCFGPVFPSFWAYKVWGKMLIGLIFNKKNIFIGIFLKKFRRSRAGSPAGPHVGR